MTNLRLALATMALAAASAAPFLANATASPSTVAQKAVKVASKAGGFDYEYSIPSEAAAIPALRRWMDAEALKKRNEMLADRRRDAAEAGDAGAPPYMLSIEWKLLAQTSQLMVFHKGSYVFSGGAHGNSEEEVIYWDRANKRVLQFGDLFTNEAKAMATVRSAFCKKLMAEKVKKMGGDASDYAQQCSDFSNEMAYGFNKIVGGKFGRLTIFCPPYSAGAYVEGSYEIELYIPKEMIPFIKPQWKASFPG